MADYIINTALAEGTGYIYDNATKIAFCTTAAVSAGATSYALADAARLTAWEAFTSADMSESTGTGTATLTVTEQTLTGTAAGTAAYVVIIDDSVPASEEVLYVGETSSFVIGIAASVYFPEFTITLQAA